ncbi:MAG: DUF4136 domain-containing protein [Planctomycetes bacterium]|nr:DUF4136 domain-containing protein [Planctomycetota bacterium]
MRRTFAVTTALLGITLTGCSEGGPVKVYAQDGPAIRVSGLGDTYSWIDSGDGKAHNAEVHDLLVQLINDGLARRGFKKAAGTAPSFWIEYRVTKENKTDSSVNPHGVDYPIGTLIIRLFDPGTKQKIWAASATARILANAPPDERKHRVQDAIQQMLSKMPPRQK